MCFIVNHIFSLCRTCVEIVCIQCMPFSKKWLHEYLWNTFGCWTITEWVIVIKHSFSTVDKCIKSNPIGCRQFIQFDPKSCSFRSYIICLKCRQSLNKMFSFVFDSYQEMAAPCVICPYFHHWDHNPGLCYR